MRPGVSVGGALWTTGAGITTGPLATATANVVVTGSIVLSTWVIKLSWKRPPALTVAVQLSVAPFAVISAAIAPIGAGLAEPAT